MSEIPRVAQLIEASNEDCSKKMQGYKCALNSKATEESMAKFVRWEPAHGRFNIRHPWKQYLKVGASIRNSAYRIQTLNGCVNSKTQAPPNLGRHLKKNCVRLSVTSSNVLQELAISMKTMKKSCKIDFSVGEMNLAVQELKKTLISVPNLDIITNSSSVMGAPGDANSEPITKITPAPVMKILPLATLVSLLIENAAKIEGIVDAVEKLAVLAEFKPITEKKPNRNQSKIKNQVLETVKTLPKV